MKGGGIPLSLRPFSIGAVVAFVALLAMPALHAAPVDVPAKTERVIEGHTVYALLSQEDPDALERPSVRQPTLVAGRGAGVPLFGNEGNGIRWMNDQDLVAPDFGGPIMGAVAVLVREVIGDPFRTIVRYPCTGGILAVNAGEADPRHAVDANTLSYVESYLITDPADHQWNVDKWTDGDSFVWSVAVRDDLAGSATADDGASSCTPYQDPVAAAATGDHGLPYPDGTTQGGRISYNALLVFFMEDLDVAGPARDHRSGSAHRAVDVAACDDTCPATGGEGNSHAYNFYASLPSSPFSSRRDGYTADCDGDARKDVGCHKSALVDLYYGTVDQPALREFRIIDTEGSTSPS